MPSFAASATAVGGSKKKKNHRLRNQATMLAIKQSTRFIAKAMKLQEDSSWVGGSGKGESGPTAYTVSKGPYKGGQVQHSEGIPFGAVMHVLRENRRDRQYKDLIKFLFFVVLFVLIQFELRSVFNCHFQNAGIKAHLLEEWFAEPSQDTPYADARVYEDTGNWEEFFIWLEGPFSQVMFRNEWYNGVSRGNYSSNGKPTRYIGTQMHILGKIAIRQVRGKPVVAKVLDGGITYEIYPDFTDPTYIPDTAPNGTVHPAYGTYISSGLSRMEGVSTGPATWTIYGNEGWLQLVPHDPTNATRLFQTMKENMYVDQGTRLVAIDFVVLNPASNVITSVRLLFESTSQGVMRHKAFIMAMPTNMYREGRHMFRAGLEGLFVLGLVYYTVVEIREMIHLRPSLYCSSIWNRLEVINLIGFWMGMSVHFYFVSQWSMGGVDWVGSEYLDIYDLGHIFQMNARLAAGNTLLAFLKVFKYLQVSDRFNLLWITLGKAMHDLVSFLVIFALFMLGFSIVGMLIFGPDIEAYSTMTQTGFTLFQMLLGDFDYNAMSTSSPLVAPFYFAIYIITVFFILMNMMISIIIMGFEQAKSYQASSQANYVHVPFVYDTTTTKLKTFWLRCSKGCGWVGLKPKHFTENKHAVHLLADPKRQVKIGHSELLKINGYKKESDHLMADLRVQRELETSDAGNSDAVRPENVADVHDKAERAMRKATMLRTEVSKSRYEHWLFNLKLAIRLKKIFDIPGIKRAYKRLLTKEGKLEPDVFVKILTVRDLATVMGPELATEAVYLYTRITGNAAHDTGAEFMHHSDSWHIQETSEKVALMQSAIENVLAMVTILAQANGLEPGNPSPPSTPKVKTNASAGNSANPLEKTKPKKKPKRVAVAPASSGSAGSVKGDGEVSVPESVKF